jgi:hypothetical protein
LSLTEGLRISLLELLRGRGQTEPPFVDISLLHKTLMEEGDGSFRHLKIGQEHCPLFVEMSDELVAIVFNVLGQRGELVDVTPSSA